MMKPKSIIIVLVAIFFLFAGYLFFHSLEQPDHIHSRDDVPQNTSDQSVNLSALILNLEKQLQNDPDNFSLLMKLGHAYLERGTPARAIIIFEKAIQLNPASAEAHTDLGVALRNDNRLAQAQEKLIQVTRDFPGFADGWLQLGVLYRFNLKNNRKALDCFQNFLLLDSQNSLVPRVKREIDMIQAEIERQKDAG